MRPPGAPPSRRILPAPRRFPSPLLFAALLALSALIRSAALPAAPPPTRLGPAERRALGARIDSLWNGGSKDSSQALLERALASARAAADSAALVDMLVRDGAHALSRGDARRAEPGLREAIAMAEARGDSAGLCAAVRWLSVAVGIEGRMPEARALYGRLQAIATALGDRRHQGWALVGMAWDAWRDGRVAEAVASYRRAAALFRESGEREGEIWAQNGLGTALSRGGDYAGAAACFARAAELARAARFAAVEIMALNNLGSLEYGLGDPGRAQVSFARARDLARQAGQAREAVNPAVNLAISLADLGRTDEAAATLDSCLVETRRHGYLDLQAQVLTELASLQERMGRPREAARLYRAALAPGLAAAVDARVRALSGLSDALAAADSAEAALAIVTEGERRLPAGVRNDLRATLELVRGRRLAESGRDAAALAVLRAAAGDAGRLGLGGLRVEALAHAARCERRLQRPDSALALCEAAARAWAAQREVPLDPQWRERRGAAGEMIYTDLAGLLLGDAPSPSPDRIAAAFDRLQAFKARTLLERMTGPGRAAAADSGAGARVIDLAALRRATLRPGELLLDYYLGPDGSLLFAVSVDAARVARLAPEAALAGKLRLYRGLLAAPPGSAEAATPDEVARAAVAAEVALLSGVEDLLRGRERVIVAADGAVNLVPLAELPRLAGCEVVRVPSATLLARLRDEAAGGISSPAAPVSGPADSRWVWGAGRTEEFPRILAIAGGSDAAGRPLAGVRDEALALGRGYRGVTVRLVEGRRTPVVLAELGGADVLHLAAHYRLDDQRPWRSRLSFGAGDSATTLTAAEVAAMRLPARLAVLSSCGTAEGRILSGEGVLGLTSAFLSAGTPAVVATLWPVDDAVTARLIARFYAELSRGATAAAALRAAQTAVRRDPATEHPFYWAGFVLCGEGSVTVPLSPAPSRASRLVAFAVLAAAVLATVFSALPTRRHPR